MITKQWILDGFRAGGLPLLAIAVISALSLIAALIAQYVFGLHPCVLCIYQRWPFAIVIALALIGLVVQRQVPALLLAALTLFANMGIAFFHVGVEQKWWKGTDACHIPDISSANTVEEYMAFLDAASVTPCDAVAWSFYGLSMAGMNVILCFALGVFSLLSALYVVRKSNGF